MVDHIHAASNSTLHRFSRACVAIHPLAEVARSVDRRLHLFLGHHGQSTMRSRAQVVAGDVDLDVIHAFAATKPNCLLDFFFAVGDQPKALVIHMRFPLVTQSASHRDLRACRANPRTRQPARVHFVANHNIEAQL